MKKAKKLLIIVITLCIAVLFVAPNAVHAEEGKLATSSIDPSKYAGGWEVASEVVADGVKMTIPGADTVGTGEAWKYKGTINNSSDIYPEFSIKDGNVVSFEFSVGYYDEDGNLLTGCQNDGGAALDIYVCDAVSGAELTIFRIWTDSGSGNNGSHSYTVYGPGWSPQAHGANWIKGDASLGDSFYIQFDKENLLSSYIGGSEEITRLDDADNTYLNGVKEKFADVEYVKFMIGGSNGFAKSTEIVLKSVNGQSLASTDGYITDNVAPTLLDAQVATSLRANEAYTIPTEAYDFFGGVSYSLRIGEDIIEGKTFTPTEGGELTVTLVAKDLAGNETTKDYTFEVSAFEEEYVAAAWKDAWKFAGGWEVTSEKVADGIKMTVPGADTVGSGEAWRYKGTINNNEEVWPAFSIKDGDVVSFEFSVGYYDEDGNLLTGCQNDGGAALDIYVCDAVSGAELTIFRIWTDSGSGNNGSHSYTVYGPGWSPEVHGANWIKGDASLGDSFYIQFDKENLISSYIGGSEEITRLDDANNTYLNAVKEKFADVQYVKFMIGGSNGFAKSTEIVLKSVNGQSLASTDGLFNDTVAPTFLDAQFASRLTVGEVYQIPVTAYDFYSSVNYSLKVGEKTYNGRTFSPSEVGELTVTLVARDAAGNEATKDITFEVVSNIAAPEITALPSLKDVNVLYFDKLSFAKPEFTDETGTATTVLKVYKGEELVNEITESSKNTFDLSINTSFVTCEYTFVYEVTNAGGTTASEAQTITITTEEVIRPEFVTPGNNVLADYVADGIRVRTTSNWTRSSFGVFDINYGLDVKFIVTEEVSNGYTNGGGTCVDFYLTNVDDSNYRIMYRVWCKFAESDADAPTNVYISIDGSNFTDITDTGWISCNVDGVRGKYHMLFDPEETLCGERTGGIQKVDRAYEALVAFFEAAPSSNFDVAFQCSNLAGSGYYEFILTELNGQSFANTDGVLTEVKDAVLEIENLPSKVEKGSEVAFDLYVKDIFATVNATVQMVKPDGSTVDLEVVDGKVNYTFADFGAYKLVASVTGTSGNEVKQEIDIVCKSSIADITLEIPEGYQANYGIGEKLTVLAATYSDNVVTKVIEMTKPDGSKVNLNVGDEFTFETSGIYVLTYKALDNAEPTPNEKVETLTINVADTTKPVVTVTVLDKAKVNDSITAEITVVDDSEYDVTVTLTKPDSTVEKLTSPYTFTVASEGTYTLKVVVEDIYGNVETITKEITVTANQTGTEDPGNGGNTSEPEKGCWGSVIPSIFSVALLAMGVVALRKKREE